MNLSERIESQNPSIFLSDLKKLNGNRNFQTFLLNLRKELSVHKKLKYSMDPMDVAPMVYQVYDLFS
ncbi:hypothetical protein FFONT_0043 [Fervidicoccus fontis Kam940]|uniref:Uncharacterized protein n=1 Tax=Fervidicoccus fontis (strain DSM 19380 / JCM 18336 / VKM B-2539 / Kam940) TaxID=1163730 RepID=H9ZZ82_FERFK|nr:hypothetical protein FFONT_0043 [Fervidicoccus fontis Kam940]